MFTYGPRTVCWSFVCGPPTRQCATHDVLHYRQNSENPASSQTRINVCTLPLFRSPVLPRTLREETANMSRFKALRYSRVSSSIVGLGQNPENCGDEAKFTSHPYRLRTSGSGRSLAHFQVLFLSSLLVAVTGSLPIDKVETSVSHISTESEIIFLDAGLRLDGIPALDLWDLIVAVLGNPNQSHKERGDPFMNKREVRSTPHTFEKRKQSQE